MQKLMSFKNKDFQFYTFFLGLKQRELISLERLFKSFPYFRTHKINVIDQSQAVNAYLQSGASKFYLSWRSYQVRPACDLDYERYEQLFSKYSDVANRIVEPELLFHGQSIDKVLRQYADARYVIVMDSDIEFKSSTYFTDVLKLCNRYNYNELAAIGTLYQRQPFHLAYPSTLDNFQHCRRPSSWRRRYWKYLHNYVKNNRSTGYVERGRGVNLGRFPRLHPALLVINREIFINYEMSFRNLYLDVLDIRQGQESEHRIFGDNGSSFLYQCAIAGKRIINVNLDDYIVHRHGTAAADTNIVRWNWFNASLSDDPLP